MSSLECDDPYYFPITTSVKPVQGQRNILITSALPYVNNVPHLGNIIGCVLSADVYARYCRLKAYNTLYVCGTDEYGTATETKALQEGVSPQQICDKYFRLHRKIYEWFNISFDIFGRTSTPKQTAVAQEIFHKNDSNGYTLEDTLEQVFCEPCGRFLADRFVFGTCPSCSYADARGDQCDACGKLLNAFELINPMCSICKAKPVPRSTRHLFLDLTSLQPGLESWFQQTSKTGSWPVNSIQITSSWLRDGLKPRCITRDLKWGVRVPKAGFEDKVFYVWFDAPIGYISITALYTDAWKDWWQNPDVKLYQFMAKDNVPFHTVIFPSTLMGTKEDWTLLHHVSSTEYLNYEGGKFSKSRGVGVFGDNAIESGIESEVWRYYLLVNRPELADSVFLWDDFAAKNNAELLNNLGNFVNRTLSFISKKFSGKVPSLLSNELPLSALETETVGRINECVANYFDQLENVKLKDGIKTVMNISRIGNEYMQASQCWSLFSSNMNRCGQCISVAVQIIQLIVDLMIPYMPTFSAKVYSQLNLVVPVNFRSEQFELNDTLAGHTIGEVKPLFRKIEAAEIDELRKKYAGRQVTAEQSQNALNSSSPYSNAVEFPLDIILAKVVKVEEIVDSEKLYVVQVETGQGIKQIVSALKPFYTIEQLLNRHVMVLCNLKPVKMAGVLSNGMILTAAEENTVGLLSCDIEAVSVGTVTLGSRVAPKGSKVVCPARFDLKKLMPLLPFTISNGSVFFANLPLQIGNPNSGVDNPSVKIDRVSDAAKIC